MAGVASAWSAPSFQPSITVGATGWFAGVGVGVGRGAGEGVEGDEEPPHAGPRSRGAARASKSVVGLIPCLASSASQDQSNLPAVHLGAGEWPRCSQPKPIQTDRGGPGKPIKLS